MKKLNIFFFWRHAMWQNQLWGAVFILQYSEELWFLWDSAMGPQVSPFLFSECHCTNILQVPPCKIMGKSPYYFTGSYTMSGITLLCIILAGWRFVNESSLLALIVIFLIGSFPKSLISTWVELDESALPSQCWNFNIRNGMRSEKGTHTEEYMWKESIYASLCTVANSHLKKSSEE